MKKKLHYIILIISLILFISVSCRKTPLNYRYKYKGEWELITIFNFWCAEPSLCTTDTTTETVKITFGDNKNEIKIGEEKYVIDNLGKLYDIHQGGCIGEFSDKNNVSYTYSYYTPGSHKTFQITGHRK